MSRKNKEQETYTQRIEVRVQCFKPENPVHKRTETHSKIKEMEDVSSTRLSSDDLRKLLFTNFLKKSVSFERLLSSFPHLLTPIFSYVILGNIKKIVERDELKRDFELKPKNRSINAK